MAAYKSARKRRPAYLVREFDEDELISILINVGIDSQNIAIGELMTHMRDKAEFPDDLPMKSSSEKAKAKPKVADDGRWLAAGQTLEVAGFVINRGLLYVGEKLTTQSKNEPSLINPTLEVIKPTRTEISMSSHYGYYQIGSYQELSPPERWLYLAWLADGRKDPQVLIGFVNLFLAGLERRVLVDAAKDPTVNAEVPAIIAELRRLLAIYVDAYLFKHHVSRLIDYLEADCHTQEKRYLRPPPDIPRAFDGFPFSVRMGLGQLAKDKKPLMADWALAWFRADSRIYKPSTAYNFADVFERLYVQVYQQEYANGFLLPINKTQLTIDYNAISTALNRAFIKQLNGLSDMAVSRVPVKKLSDVAFKCHEILQPYSRFLSRSNKEPDSLDATLLLPMSLWPEAMLSALDALRVGLDHAPRMITLGEIAQQLLAEDHFVPSQIVGLLKTLELRGIGLEPDVAAIDSTIKLTSSDTVVLFNTLADDRSTRQNPVYIAASLTIDLAVFVAKTSDLDGTIFTLWMQQRIESWTHLSITHRQRLNARVHHRWLREATTLAGFKKRITVLADNMRQPIAQLLAQVAQSQGLASSNAIKYLERVYTALQINNQQLYTDLHISSTTTTIAKVATDGKKSAAVFTLDVAKIAQLQQETAQVSALLADVFVEDDENPTPATTVITTSAVDLTSAPNADCLLGLDETHSLFLRQVAPRLLWPRAELLALATQCDLMLDGALEHINEIALDRWDEPLFDGDDPIDINPELIEKFLA